MCGRLLQKQLACLSVVRRPTPEEDLLSHYVRYHLTAQGLHATLCSSVIGLLCPLLELFGPIAIRTSFVLFSPLREFGSVEPWAPSLGIKYSDSSSWSAKVRFVRISDVIRVVFVANQNGDIERPPRAVLALDRLEQSNFLNTLFVHDDSCWAFSHGEKKFVDIIDMAIVSIKNAN